jgi:hypothetical protein
MNSTCIYKIGNKGEIEMATCSKCNWYRNKYCKLNPQAVSKDPADTCSHWTPKMVNEVTRGGGTYIAPKDNSVQYNEGE